MPGRAAQGPPRPHRALHPGHPAGAVAAHLRRDLHPPACHPHRRRALPGLPGPRDHGPVGPVHRHLLRHPDHLGARRRDPGQAAHHPDPAGRPGLGQGVRGRRAGHQPGRRRPRPVGPARRPPALEPAGPAGHGRGHRARLGLLRHPVGVDRRPGPVPRTPHGHRPGHHHAPVLRLQRPLPGRPHARLAARHQRRQPPQLRGQRAAHPAPGPARQPPPRPRRPGRRRGRRGRRGRRPARPPGPPTRLRRPGGTVGSGR